MPRILLVRHGQTQWNRQGRAQGHGDSPLTLKGVMQAQAYGRTIRALMEESGEGGWRLIASPLPRCLQTASIIADEAGLDYGLLVTDDRLREVSTGQWSGVLKADLPAHVMAGTGTKSWMFCCPGGENFDQVRARMASFLADRSPGERLVVVGHGVSGRVLRGLYLGLDGDQAVAGESPQDTVFRMGAGQIQRIACK